jgi:hypothetical protein
MIALVLISRVTPNPFRLPHTPQSGPQMSIERSGRATPAGPTPQGATQQAAASQETGQGDQFAGSAAVRLADECAVSVRHQAQE